MTLRLFARLLVALPALAVAACAHGSQAAGASAAHARDVEALRSAVIRSGEAASAGDPEAVMALYARDVVLSYPGEPDRGYAELAEGYRRMLRTPGVTLRTEPTIEEILVSGDLAVVRVVWSTVVTETDPPRRSARRMKDLQVWRRERDGWKFARGMHYRMSPSADPAAPPAGPASGEAPVLRVVARDYAFDAPARIVGGVVTVRLVNRGSEPHYLRLLRLAPGKTLADYTAWRESGAPMPDWIQGAGGPAPVMPGDSVEQTTPLRPGSYVILCGYPTEAGVPHSRMGMVGSLEVAPPPAREAALLRPAEGRIELVDYGYRVAGEIRAGTRTLEVENRGREPHQLLLVRLPPGVSAADEVAWFAGGSRGPRPGIPRGGILEVLPGERTRFTRDLEPGSYLLLCGIRAPDGRRHFEHGMVGTLSVNP